MLTTDSWGVFPESAGDLRGKTLGFGVRGPFFGDDGDVVSAIEKDPGCNETGYAAADDENVVREGGRWFKRCWLERDMFA